ncbi:MAG TPA: tail fiber domain-containing protein [Thermoanaerobaculia bacterium]|nr:tail fiber domain-containing protein [Thermoanaerobaculia bacterium]
MEKSTRTKLWGTGILVLALGGLLAVPAGAAGPAQLAAVNVSSVGIEWQPNVSYEKLVLTVSGPGGLVLRRELAAGTAPSFGVFGDDGKPLPDGAYTYELVASPVLDRATRRAMAHARQTGDDSTLAKLQVDGKLPRTPLQQSGTFTIKDGTFVSPDLREEASRAPRASKAAGPVNTKDQVVADDEIVQGSLCVGLDCVANESFGFDTIRLKENNTRIKFDDTSSSTGFPANDWQLTANDSASGGANKFSIEDITGSKVPFTVTAGAPTNSIFVDSTGRVGFRTSTPVLDLHVATSNTPAMRLEQNNSGGFTAQTWDIAGNEANFFVRDVTGGSRLPFRIRPGAPTSSIDISATGNVGIGTASPSTKLHVTSSDSGTTDGKVFIENTSATSSPRELLELKGNGGVAFILDDTSDASRWTTSNIGSQYLINNQANTGIEVTITSTGSMTIAGTLTQGSSRDIKTGFDSLAPKEALSRVAALPVSLWSYKTEKDVRHVGPMAEDFHQAFGLGADDKHIAPGDQAGVALLAVQGLNQVVQEKDREIADLKSRIEALEKLVQSLAQDKAVPASER